MEKCWHTCTNIDCAREFSHEVKGGPLDTYWQLCIDCALKESQNMTNGKAHEKILSKTFSRSTEAPEDSQRQGRANGWGTIEAPEPSDLFTDGDTRFALAVALEPWPDFAESEL